MKYPSAKQAACEDCGRPCHPASRLCRRCVSNRDDLQRLEEAAWKNQAWGVFTRIELLKLLEA